MKRRLNILSILVFIVLGLSLYTTGYQFGTGMKAGMSLAKEQHKESKACDRPMLAGDFRFVDVVPTIAMIQPDTIINAQNNEKVPVMYTQMAVRTERGELQLPDYQQFLFAHECTAHHLRTYYLCHADFEHQQIADIRMEECPPPALAGQSADYVLRVLPDSAGRQLLGTERSIRT